MKKNILYIVIGFILLWFGWGFAIGIGNTTLSINVNGFKDIIKEYQIEGSSK